MLPLAANTTQTSVQVVMLMPILQADQDLICFALIAVQSALVSVSQPTVYMFKKISTLFSIGVQYGGDNNQYYAKTIGKTSYKNIKKETELKMKIITFLFTRKF